MESKSKTIKFLLERCSDYTIRNHVKQTPKELAIERHWLDKREIMMILLKNQKMNNYNLSIQYKMVSIIDACWSGNLERVRELIAGGVDVNSIKPSILHIASIYGHQEIVLELLKHHANPNNHDVDNCSPLHDAVFNNNTEIVKTLITYGANINMQTIRGHTPLYMAVHECRFDIVKLLLENGADFSIKDNRNQTPKDIALEKLKFIDASKRVDLQRIIDLLQSYEDIPEIKEPE